MANQFPPPVFNGQFPPQPFYQPYQANAQTPQAHSATPYQQPGIPQHIPFPAPVANAKRFEANGHVPSPPPAFQLPPNWDPEVLKRLASSSNLPFPFPPPPPPPPPPHFFSAPFAPPSQASPVPPVGHGQSYQNFPQPQPLLRNLQPTEASGSQHEYNPTDVGIPGLISDTNSQSFQENRPSAGASRYTHIQTLPGLDGVSPSRALSQEPEVKQTSPRDHHEDDVSAKAAPSAGNISMSVVEHHSPVRSPQELIEQAKVAIKECRSVGATYQDFIDGGVNQNVVDKLFSQLNIAIPLPVIQPQAQIVPQEGGTTNGTTTPQPTTIPLAEAVNPAMERKDRIAQLLAARKGQAAGSAKSSQSASPAPIEPPEPLNSVKSAVRPIWNPVEKVFETPADSDASGSQSEQNHSVTESSVEAEPLESKIMVDVSDSTNAEILDQAALPTPVREAMIQQGFSIPGLFMTSAEPKDVALDLKADSLTESVEQPRIVVSSTAPKSLKRGADALISGESRSAKRQASHAVRKLSSDEDISEAVPHTSQLEPAIEDGKDQMLVQDTNKRNADDMPAAKPKVDTNKLKARLAAFKAEKERQNARLKALRDGMPMLDAEVSKTRDSLQDQQDRLEKIRQDIARKVTELDQSRDEENRLMQEIAKLQNQLADGEDGQMQFSNEMSSLSDQVRSDIPLSSPAIVHDNTSRTGARDLNDASATADSSTVTTFDANVVPGLSGVEQPEDRVGTETSDERRSQTVCSPEQEDLDRQLNSEVVTTMDSPNEIAVEQSLTPDAEQQLETQPYPPTGAETESQPSVRTTPPEEGMIEDEVEEDDRMSIDEASNADSDGSASMSDSGSEDYEPAVRDDIQQEGSEEGEEYEPAEATPYQRSTDASNDEYEPMDQIKPVKDTTMHQPSEAQMEEAEAAFSPLVSTAPTEVSVTLEPRSTTDPQRAVEDAPFEVVSKFETGINRRSRLDEGVSHTERLPLLEPLTDKAKSAVQRYAPYESPLAMLKTFRFNPLFNDTVKGGYRSLTYSNNIDEKKPVCFTELQGEPCDDPNCGKDYQHFSSMALSDDKILVQMSSANDITNKDEKDKYLLGLKKIIAGLRANGVKEFSEVATALSKYRREWFLLQNGLLP